MRASERVSRSFSLLKSGLFIIKTWTRQTNLVAAWQQPLGRRLFFLKGKRSENKVLAAVKLVIYQARREIATRFLPGVHEITALRCTNTSSLAGAG